MASVSVLDVGSVIDAIRESILVVQDQSRANKEKEEQARLTVYRALSIHPALASMRPPTGELGDLDWYSELRHPLAFFGGIFKRIGQNEHFRRASLLGETGRRVRIMLLLCWVIGHRLSIDRINQLISTTVEDALNTVLSDRTDVRNLTQLLDVRKVLESITQMIRTHLPLPSDRNPFYGEDFSSEDEDNPLPHSELWAYSLPEDQRYEFDIKSHPSILLRPHPIRVLIPTTKLSLFAIQWTSRIFGLGKKILAVGEIDPTAFWNADPPAPSPPEMSDEEMGSISGSDNLNDDLGADDLSEAWEDLPLDDWIHERFCYCILLLQTFAVKRGCWSALNISRTLRRRLGYDVCCLIEPFLILEGFGQWDSAEENRWIPGFSVMSEEERGMSIIFADAYKFHFTIDNHVPYISDFNVATLFLTHPEIECPGKPDVLGIPILHRLTNIPNFPIPELDSSTCSCGQCSTIQESLVRNFENFHMKYFSLDVDLYEVETRCNALEKAWEPLFTDVESWVDSLLGRIEIAFDLFPYLSERRLGPSILYALHLLKYKIRTHLDTKQLLVFFSLLRFSHIYPDSIVDSLPELAGDVFAYLADDEPDRGQDFVSPLDENTEIVLSSAGGWLYDTVSGSGLHDQNTQISFLRSSPALSIRVHSRPPDGIIAIGMPEHETTIPTLLPHAHELLDAPESAQPQAPLDELTTGQIVFDIGPRGHHGFPLLPGVTNSIVVLGAQISTTYSGRIIRTLWRPDVRFGRTCQHVHMYHRMTRCSLTSHEILLQVRPTLASLRAILLPGAPCTARAHLRCEEHNDLFYEDHKRSTCYLTERCGPFAHSKYCIVRCGDAEGPADPIIVLAGSLGRRVYIFHRRECWDCACSNMRSQGLGLGIAFGTKVTTKCAHCLVDDRRANRIANQIEEDIRMG